MFQGETAITVDDKGRLAIPMTYRDVVAGECGNRLVLTYNPFESGCLWLYPHADWEQLCVQVNALPKAKAANREMQRKLVGSAAVIELDATARILLPPSMRLSTGIEKKVVLLGMGNKFELWSERAHLARIQTCIGEDELTAELEALPL